MNFFATFEEDRCDWYHRSSIIFLVTLNRASNDRPIVYPQKELLIKILRAARSRDNGEVDRLLSDLKQTRKKRTRRIKAEKLGITSTPIQSPDNVMAEDYYHSQQQQQQQRSPYQWVRLYIFFPLFPFHSLFFPFSLSFLFFFLSLKRARVTVHLSTLCSIDHSTSWS